MGAETPAAGGEKKPFIKHKYGTNNQHGKGYNNSCCDNTPRKEKFLRADPDLCGHVFEAKRNQSEQVVNFTTIDNIIKAHVGTECDPFVLESKEDGSMTKIE